MLRSLLQSIIVILVGGGIWFFGRDLGLDRLPGNFDFEVGGGRVTVPVLACVIVSVGLSLIFRFLRRF